jgi:hypothetical protein
MAYCNFAKSPVVGHGFYTHSFNLTRVNSVKYTASYSKSNIFLQANRKQIKLKVNVAQMRSNLSNLTTQLINTLYDFLVDNKTYC